jgi:LysR family hydrogen peroxide-inducible transcriptional activator
MTITQLNYIVAVDSHRHFARAAEKCFVTQPTLSMQIRKLEDELDVVIFDRSKQPVNPTEIGAKIIAQARIVLQESGRIAELIRQDKGEVSGEYRLGIIPTIAPSLLPRFLSAFMKSYPKVRLVVEELQTDQIVSKLRKDLLDGGILATPLGLQGIVEQPLYYEPFMAYIPEGHRLQKEEFVLVSELDLNDILLLNEGHCFRNNVMNICKTAFDTSEERKLQLESGNFDTLTKLVRQGYGMTLIPYLHALELTQQEDQQRIKPFARPKPTREISLVYSRAELKMPIVNAMAEIIKNSVPEQLLTPAEDGFVSSIQ